MPPSKWIVAVLSVVEDAGGTVPKATFRSSASPSQRCMGAAKNGQPANSPATNTTAIKTTKPMPAVRHERRFHSDKDAGSDIPNASTFEPSAPATSSTHRLWAASYIAERD